MAILYLAIGFPVNIAYKDFLASGMDFTEEDADEFFVESKNWAELTKF